MALVEAEDFPEIRALLDAQLTANDLRDTVIAADVHLGAASREVLGRIPNAQAWVDAGDEDGLRVKRIVKLLTAASLAPVVVRLTSVSVQGRDGAYSRQTFDPVKRAAELRGQAQAELALLAEYEEPPATTFLLPRTFVRATGRRGR